MLLARTTITWFILAIASCPLALAQFVKEYQPFPVIVDGDTLALPFWGGINSPKPSLVDFDRDGKIDLFIGETIGKLNYLHNTGTTAMPIWTPISERFANLDIGTWHAFVDIDGDSDLDLFCDNLLNGVRYLRNSSVGNDITFVQIDPAYGAIATGVDNTPDFVDLDGDNDFDLFIPEPGGQLVFYRNTGTPATPNLVFVTGFYDSLLAFPGGGSRSLSADPQHGFAAIHFVDIDNDLDLDLIWGDLFNPNLYLFRNHGTRFVSDLTYETDTYLGAGNSTTGFNHAPLADLDGDGDFDLLLSPANGEIIDNLRFFRNIGTATSASFALEELNLLENIDLGRSAVPALGDVDGDSDLDLLVGSGDGRIAWFRNVGSRLNPVLELQTSFFQNIDVGQSAAPALTDWDDDGDLDLLIGNESGFVQYYRNDGDSCAFLATLVTTQLGGIKTDQLAVPAPVDLDRDGLTDLVIGEWDFNGFANVLLYENTGSAGNPALTLVTKSLLKRTASDFTIPHAVDWDGDGKTDLVVGNRGLGLTWFRNTATAGVFPDSNTLLAQPDTLPGADVGNRIAMTRGDIDSDGDYDLILGEEDGGLNFFRRSGGATYRPGDADGNGAYSIADAVFLVNYIFAGGNAPNLTLNGDADCNGALSIADAVFLVNYIFAGGLAPCRICAGT